MADKYHSDTQEKIETIAYSPGLKDSGDLEAGTKTITATSEASGVGNADYSAALTAPESPDSRLMVSVVSARLACTIDSMTAGHLYCRVYVDAQDADHRLMDLDWTTTGTKLKVEGPYSEYKPTIFNLLKDGGEHTFYFFFWVDSGNAVISAVQLWEAVGGPNNMVFRLQHTGLVWANARLKRVGSGTPTLWFRSGRDLEAVLYTNDIWKLEGDDKNHEQPSTALIKDGYFNIYSPVNTDLAYIYKILIVLRSLQ